MTVGKPSVVDLGQLRFGCDLVFCAGMAPSSAEEAIRSMADVLVGRGNVRDSFKAAVVDRERKYPTGLPTSPVGVALPHADPEHVIRPAIVVAVLSGPVPFRNMGDPSSFLDVQVVILLALADAESQIRQLQRISTLLGSPETLREIVSLGADASGKTCRYRTLKALFELEEAEHR